MTTSIFDQFPFATEAGDPFRAYDRTYYLDRVDEDGAVTLRSRHGSGEGDFMVVDDDGMPRKPTVDEILELMSRGDVVRMERRLERKDAQFRRAADLDSDQARELDALCAFRMTVVRLIERGRKAGRQSLSDAALERLVKEVWKTFKKNERDRKIRKRAGCPKAAAEPKWKRPKRKPVGSTVREWYHTRGSKGSRKTSDGVSGTGRAVRARKIDHPIEILAYYSTKVISGKAKGSHALRDYRAELKCINEGRDPPGQARNRAEVDDDGRWSISETTINLPGDYPAPASAYTPVSQCAFYDLVRIMRSKKAYAIQTSAMGAMQRYEGGGKTEVPSRIGMLGEIDDTPLPNLFLMCEVTGLPLGGATGTVIIDVCSRIIPGADVSWERANTNTVLRTVLDANQPKKIPQKMLDDLPKEAVYLAQFAPSWAMSFDRILGDNLSAYHGKDVEDALLDVGPVAEFTGKHKPRAKPHVESVLGKLQDLYWKILPDARWDIELAERFGYDPDKHVLCTLQQARELFALAVIIHNCTRHSGLDGLQPALVRKQHNDRYLVNLIDDEERLRRAIMRSEKNLELANDGIRVFNRRYSQAQITAQLYQDHENAHRKKANHLGPKQKKRHNVGHKQDPTYTVRIKYDVDDLGSIYVWNPHHLPKGDWCRVPCTDTAMVGRSKELHDRRFDLLGEDADDFLDQGTEDLIHAYLHNETANITEASSAREKAKHAKVMDSPAVQTALRNHVHVASERDLTAAEHHVVESGPKMPASNEYLTNADFAPKTAPTGVAAPYRKDGDTNVPRPDPTGRKRKPSSETPSIRGNRIQNTSHAHNERKPRPKRRSGSLGWGDIA